MAVAAISYVTTTTTVITIRCPNYNIHQKKNKFGFCSQRNSQFSSINNGKTSTTLSIITCSASNKPSSSSPSPIRHLSLSLSLSIFMYIYLYMDSFNCIIKAVFGSQFKFHSSVCLFACLNSCCIEYKILGSCFMLRELQLQVR